MRQITKESINAFLNAKKFNKQNMSVQVLPNVTVLKLHGNEIAYLYNDPNNTLSISNCGWFTPTTSSNSTRRSRPPIGTPTPLLALICPS